MIRRFLLTTLTLGLVLSVPVATSWGRGFGGGGRGGFGGGGFGGGGGFDRGGGGFGGGFGGGERSAGGFSSGGSREGGGFSSGGFGGGERSAGGFSGGGFGGERNAGGFGGGERGAGSFGQAGAGGRGAQEFGGDRFSQPSRSQLGSFLGMPSDEGLHNLSGGRQMGSNFDVNKGATETPRGGYAAGASVTGPQGNTAYRGAAVGPQGGAAAARGFEGAGGAAGVQAAARGPAGGYAAAGAVRGPEGAAAAGFARVSPSGRYTAAAAVRTNYNHWGVYGRGWYTAHPGAWFTAGWAAGTAWLPATWASLGDWMSYYPLEPVYYDYGSNVTYQDNSVYVNGQSVGTADQYYQQAADLASAGAKAEAPTDGQWLPLGVFALTKSGEQQSAVTIQLAVNKQGVIRGNYTDTATDKTQLVQGQVDKETQRVAFTVGGDQSHLIETGLYNLTKDEAPCLVHIGKARTEQWLLVRLQKPAGAQ